MTTFVKMPRLSLTMTEGVIAKWLKKEKEFVKKGEPLVEIESDKAVSSFESPEEGYLIKILVAEGDVTACQSDIAVLGEQGEESVSSATAENVAQNAVAVPGKHDDRSESSVATEGNVTQDAGDRIFASPAARRIAREHGVDLSELDVAPGKTRIEQKDVMALLQGSSKAEAEPARSGAKITEDAVVGLSVMRKAIAANMRRSLDIAAHVSLTTEADMGKILELRAGITDAVSEQYGVSPSLNDILLKCVAHSLSLHPRLNSVFDGSNIILRGDINLGVAVALDDGLIVPVIRNCDRLSIGEIAAQSNYLVNKARGQGLSKEEMSEGSFTVSNLGAFGITQFTSIINQPESAILSIGQIVKKPVVTENDEIAIRYRMNMTINFDHRSIDGAVAAMFLQTLVKFLEDPYLILV